MLSLYNELEHSLMGLVSVIIKNMLQHRRIFVILLAVTTQSLNEQISGQNYDPLDKQYGTVQYAALVSTYVSKWRQ